jgi:hypothetical protein
MEGNDQYDAPTVYQQAEKTRSPLEKILDAVKKNVFAPTGRHRILYLSLSTCGSRKGVSKNVYIRI